jgi:hypothetical protein
MHQNWTRKKNLIFCKFFYIPPITRKDDHFAKKINALKLDEKLKKVKNLKFPPYYLYLTESTNT